MKLFTIGDSLSQGFMSLSPARTDLCYSTLISHALGINNYTYPEFKFGGIGINLENVLRSLEVKFGNDIKGIEWAGVLCAINDTIDLSEDHYERKEGREDMPYDGGNIEYFDNISVAGFQIADAWNITPGLCADHIKYRENKKNKSDNFLQGPCSSFFRNGLKVLNPSLKKEYMNFTQLDWLDSHHNDSNGQGVENLILFLGANNALASIVSLQIVQTPNDADYRPHKLNYYQRKDKKWNLWHPVDFELEYEELIARVNGIMSKKKDGWNVFVGTIPLVTICPLIKGVGESHFVEREGRDCVYFKYYTYFPYEEDFATQSNLYLSFQDALFIDDCIRQYNQSIRKIIAMYNEKNGREAYHVVDICNALNEMALKRNDYNPTYKYPDYFTNKYPRVDTKFYNVDRQGNLKQGGLFSLDGVHPSAIGQGLLAYEFLKTYDKVYDTGLKDTMNWNEIFNSDSLYSKPISLINEIYQHDNFTNKIIDNWIKKNLRGYLTKADIS
jgi:hypothetical protein